MKPTKVFLIGGHGRTAQLLTPLLLARSWNVTSLIRSEAQRDAVLQLGKNKPGKIDVLVKDLEEIKTEDDAKIVIESVKPDYVVWAAGASAKSGSDAIYAVDRDAAKSLFRASVSTPTVSKVLSISHLGSRKARPSWWSDEEWKYIQYANSLHYDTYLAKSEADELLTALARRRVKEAGDKAFQGILLRPGRLSDVPFEGKVGLGQCSPGRPVTRADVAAAADRLLAREDTWGWVDIAGGDEAIDHAVERIGTSQPRVDAIEGEDLERIYALT
ncbi:hypothetical protein NFIA_085580 [Paecilomyces variotii No. 5]|uniref:NAD(P)-binding domain-containing protein n=1 Tax=Byssochlamys spectabilis (strain No. 5 / NBRC 109023) TaxID=1356009 RepID=V5I5H9_BYSSN|nr:hypothetical protein NFIA_085580 [Paecilomyces variotii No. 5]